MSIKEEYLFSKLYTPKRKKNGGVLTIGVLPENLKQLEPNQHYIIKFYKLRIDG